uniref:Uncharacterized protein n=1 Tax=Zea mays TaxID=4577 RepID=B6SXW7_MAIZE|nr:hypothetical protein [Zea mays]|eukprot:NP_001143202.1 uncharacterized protein LOC100275705 [Zea mays]
MQYLSSPTPISRGDTIMLIAPTQGFFINDTLSPNNFLFGIIPGYYLTCALFNLFRPYAIGNILTLCFLVLSLRMVYIFRRDWVIFIITCSFISTF